MNLNPENFPPRPAWTEIDLGKLRRNLQLIRGDLPKNVRLMAVVKDEAMATARSTWRALPLRKAPGASA